MEEFKRDLLKEQKDIENRALQTENFIYNDPKFETMSKDLKKLACQELCLYEALYRVLSSRIDLEKIKE
jgi:hypothetical protein